MNEFCCCCRSSKAVRLNAEIHESEARTITSKCEQVDGSLSMLRFPLTVLASCCLIFCPSQSSLNAIIQDRNCKHPIHEAWFRSDEFVRQQSITVCAAPCRRSRRIEQTIFEIPIYLKGCII
jgi:hypothetical protein